MITSILIVLVLNLLIELTVAYALGYRRKYELYAVGLVNLLTNPLMNYILWVGIDINLLTTLILELAVILVEACALGFAFKKAAKKYLILSVVMNVASCGTGWILANYWF